MSDYVEISDLTWALMAVLARFELDSIAAARRLPDGHLLTLRLSAPNLITIEHDGGQVVTYPLAEIGVEE